MSKEVSKDTKKKIIIGIVVLLVVLAVILFLLLNRKEQYEVSFNSNGGTIVASLIIDENGYVVKPEDPTRENYVFAGWYLDGEPFDFSKPITGDVKLEARWVEIGRVNGVSLDKNTLSLNVGDTAKLNATVTPDDAADKEITWSSSDTSVVSVDSKGNVKALKTGTAVITVTTKDGNFVAKAVITVVEKEEEEKEPEKPTEQPVKVTSITINKTNLDLYVNEGEKLTVTVKPDKATNKEVVWSSSDTSVVSVDSKGNVKALKAGTAVVTVTTKDGNFKATCKVTVSVKVEEVKVTSVELNKASLNLYVNEGEKLTATVKPDNATNKEVVWSSSDASIVSVDQSGNVKALKAGTAVVTVTTKDGSYKATCTVTVSVKVEEVKVTSVTLDKTSLSLEVNGSSKLTATVKPDNATNKEVVWSSSDTSVVSVDQNGNVKALKAGTATITVTTKDGSYKATCTVTVKKPEVTDVYVVTLTPEELMEGVVKQYKVTVTKNGNACAFKHVIYNGEKLGKYADAGKVATTVATATVRLADGTDVPASVVK